MTGRGGRRFRGAAGAGSARRGEAVACQPGGEQRAGQRAGIAGEGGGCGVVDGRGGGGGREPSLGLAGAVVVFWCILPCMTNTSPPSDDAAFDRMFAASLASMSKTPTPEALRASIQALIDHSGLSHDEVATVLDELGEGSASKAERASRSRSPIVAA